MPVPIEALHAKALGSVNAIKAMGERERLQNPPVSFGMDYNALRELIARELPNIKELLPPAAQSFSPEQRLPYTQGTYSNFLVYYSQLADMLLSQLPGDQHDAM